MQRYQLIFIQRADGASFEIRLRGIAKALALGVKVALAGAPYEKLKEMGKTNSQLFAETFLLHEVEKENVQAYSGTYLNITEINDNSDTNRFDINIFW